MAANGKKRIKKNKVLKKIVLGAWHYEKKNITDKKRKIS